MGCDIAQGYQLSQPLPATAFAEFVRSRAAQAASANLGRRG